MSKKLEERIIDFNNALNRLEEATTKDLNDDIIIDGIIQRFEFTFELGWKMIKLYLEDQGIVDEALAPRSTIKCGFKYKVIEDSQVWIDMMLDRNRTSHMYDQELAVSMVTRIKERYITEFKKLLIYVRK